MRNTQLKRFIIAASFSLIVIMAGNPVSAQSDQDKLDAAKAMEYVRNNRQLEALPIFEKIIGKFPRDAEMWASYGVAIIIKATTVIDKEEREALHLKGLAVLATAKELGTQNPTALDLLEQFLGSGGADNFENENPEVEAALRQGEAFFASGKYEEAFVHYKKAHDLDPTNYEAVLFMGDCYYALERYAEAIPYFQQAVDIDPERPKAHQFWADALLYDGKYDQALDKFIDVIIRDPFSNTSWGGLRNWGEISENEFSLVSIAPPGSDLTGPAMIDPVLLSRIDGTDSWLLYAESVRGWIEKSGDTKVRFTILDEERAWKAVAEGYLKAKKAGRVKTLNGDLENLVRLNDDGLLLPYLYYVRGREPFSDDYDLVVKNQGIMVRKFFKKYFFNIEEKKNIGF